MARNLRLEFPGALYHITARGNEKRAIYQDEVDRVYFLRLFSRELEQQRWRCHAYCLMDNHYHLLLETPEPNLSRGMRRLNSAYSARFNARHRRVGHLLQGRYHAVIVERDTYLLELARYIVLNPVRAGLVLRPEDWPWSSFRATAVLEPAPTFLHVQWLLGFFSENPHIAAASYRRFVNERNVRNPWDDARGKVWLGSRGFRARMQDLLARPGQTEIPAAQKQPLRPSARQIVDGVLRAYGITEAELWSRVNQAAFQTAVYLLRRVGNLTLKAVSQLSGVSPARISTIQRDIERGRRPEGLDDLARSLGHSPLTAPSPERVSEPGCGYRTSGSDLNFRPGGAVERLTCGPRHQV